MFIHRPDMLDKESTSKNIAELIVAKHRNGPTHPGIKLVFLRTWPSLKMPPPSPANLTRIKEIGDDVASSQVFPARLKPIYNYPPNFLRKYYREWWIERIKADLIGILVSAASG